MMLVHNQRHYVACNEESVLNNPYSSFVIYSNGILSKKSYGWATNSILCPIILINVCALLMSQTTVAGGILCNTPPYRRANAKNKCGY